MRLRSRGAAWVLVALLSSIPLQAQIEDGVQAEERIEGRSVADDVDFSARAETQDFVVVSLVVQDSVEIRAEIDYARGEVKIRASAPGSSRPTGLSPSDRTVLANLAASDRWRRGGRTEDALASTLNFLDSLPLGSTVDFATAKSKSGIEKSISSLCSRTGSTVSGSYSVNGKTISVSDQLGPCYSKPNECLGRCGKGCSAPPSVSIQRFTQDCFNHDLCTRATGDILGECRDEFDAAVDDFFFAPDCGTLQGTWMDNFSYKYDLRSVSLSPLSVIGKVQTTLCLDWNVRSSHEGAAISLVATNPRSPTEACCTSFTYSGTAIDCNTASGTWVNGGCVGSGVWTMVRNARGVQLIVTDDKGNAAIPGVRP